tara:strand:+ start:621 stop:1349 length:729 start_codon:yes stop_codon:yes gene_type:complete
LSYNSDTHLVVIPTYNEIDNIAEFITQILEFNVSLLIVDDNSPDGTGEFVETILDQNNKIHLLKRNSKLGLGSAYRDGFKWGLARDYEYFIEMDADFSHSFDDLEKILNKSLSFELVIGSRYVNGGGSVGWDLKRRLLSKYANKFSSIFLKSNLNDMTSGFRCYSRNALEKVDYANTKSDGYAFQIEMSLRCAEKNLLIDEVPIIFNERRLGKSKMSKKIVREAFVFLIKNGVKRWLKIKIF